MTDPRRAVAESEAILADLTTRQHLRPQMTVADVLEQTTAALDCCPQAVSRAIQWLGVDSHRPIGRLRRSELVQLSRAIHRFWTQAISAAADAPK